MTVLSALVAPLERRVIRDEQLWGSWARGEDVVTDVSAAGVRVTRDSALRLSAVYACVRLIADAIAGRPPGSPLSPHTAPSRSWGSGARGGGVVSAAPAAGGRVGRPSALRLSAGIP